MPDVEAKLNITAEYKQAMLAIVSLGKALDAVQQKAKLVTSVSSAGGNLNAGAGVSPESNAAIAALAAAMKEAASSSAVLAESVAKLAPALAAMGPNAEQVQQVLSLSANYKDLASSISQAAEAAAKYNVSGALQGQTDARIKSLMDENERLMSIVISMREEYAEVLKRNAQRAKSIELQQEEAEAVKKKAAAEKESSKQYEDRSYEMRLAIMTKRELIDEINRLTAARKAAADAGDKTSYNDRTEQMKLARQALAKLRQEQQVSKIAWLQQVQVAQQLGNNVKTVVGGFMNFSESLEKGTVDLTSMTSAIVSMSLAIKAGLGPLGWALLAVQALTEAWNYFARQQEEAAKKERMYQEDRIARLKKVEEAYREAADAAEEQRKKEVSAAEIKAVTDAYEAQNEKLRERQRLLEITYRQRMAELSLEQTEEEISAENEKAAINRQFIRGDISERQRDAMLDALSLKMAQSKERREVTKAEEKLNMEDEAFTRASGVYTSAAIEKRNIEKEGKVRFKFSPQVVNEKIKAIEKLEEEINLENDETLNSLNKQLAEAERFLNPNMGGQYGIAQLDAEDKVKKIQKQIEDRIKQLEAENRKEIESKALSFFLETGWTVNEAKKEYDQAYSTFQSKKGVIDTNYNSTKKDFDAAEKRFNDAQFNYEQTKKKQRLAVKRVEDRNKNNADARDEERDREEAQKKNAKKLAKLEKELATMDEASIRKRLRVAKSNASYLDPLNEHTRNYYRDRVSLYKKALDGRVERQKQLQLAATNERDWEGGRSTRLLNDIIGGDGVKALRGGLNSAELSSLKKGLADATRLQNDAAKELIKYIFEMARSQKNTSTSVKQKIDQIYKANF